MESRYVIGPSIGIARIGNSSDSFYLPPDELGQLPIECDSDGNPSIEPSGAYRRVRKFKDPIGAVRRQAARFQVFSYRDDEAPVEVTLASADVASITWRVHLANKKAVWYNFAELEGNLLYGPQNSYKNKKIPLRNSTKSSLDARRNLIIDPGPRSLTGALQRAEFSKASSGDYAFTSFPGKPTYGAQISTLGEIRTDEAGRLLVLGGYGRAGGDATISSFAGADSWHDDISDGPVTCTISLKSGAAIELQAWCIVGSPKFVPEITNIVTLYDVMFDVAVRHLGYMPGLFSDGAFVDSYEPLFDRDIRPILERPAAYRWVANVPSLASVSPAAFSPRDSSAKSSDVRKAYAELFRKPSPDGEVGTDANRLFASNGFPMMPLNSGSNSVSNAEGLIDKFLTLTAAQFFFLQQWVNGKFSATDDQTEDPVARLTRASLGSCVGAPLCPGIEVTWSVRNRSIYKEAFAIRHRHDADYYAAHGLDPMVDETEDRDGCEPGDLTKRMAIPWQADFFQCSIQYINFTRPDINKLGSIPVPPTYYAYWWPPQSPWHVLSGDALAELQVAAGTPAGFQVLYARGINTFAQMITAWSYLGFVVNQTDGAYRELFPYFAEQERNHSNFVSASVAIGDGSNVVTGEDSNFSNTWFLAPDSDGAPTATVAEKPEELPIQQAISFVASRNRGRQAFRD